MSERVVNVLIAIESENAGGKARAPRCRLQPSCRHYSGKLGKTDVLRRGPWNRICTSIAVGKPLFRDPKPVLSAYFWRCVIGGISRALCSLSW